MEDWQRDDYEPSGHRTKVETGAERAAREMQEGVDRVRAAAIARGERQVPSKDVTVRRVDPATLRAPAAPEPPRKVAIPNVEIDLPAPPPSPAPRAYGPRVCDGCPMTFLPSGPRQRFHSVECRQRFHGRGPAKVQDPDPPRPVEEPKPGLESDATMKLLEEINERLDGIERTLDLLIRIRIVVPNDDGPAGSGPV